MTAMIGKNTPGKNKYIVKVFRLGLVKLEFCCFKTKFFFRLECGNWQE